MTTPQRSPYVSDRAAAYIAAGDFVGLVRDFKCRHGIQKKRPRQRRDPDAPAPQVFAGLRPRTSSFKQIVSDKTGLIVDPDRFLRGRARADLLHEQTVFLAGVLERNGVKAYRKQNADEPAVWQVGLLTGVARQLDGKRFCNLSILPEPSQRERNERALTLEAYLHAHQFGSEARYHVQTYGQRVRVDDPFVVARRRAIRRATSRDLIPLLRDWGVDLDFVGLEAPVALDDDEDSVDYGQFTLHDHNNYLLLPREAGVNWSAIERVVVDFWSRQTLPGDTVLTERHGRHATVVGQDLDGRRRLRLLYRRHGRTSAEPVRNVRELCKYISKCEDLVSLATASDALFMQYFRDLQAVRTYSLYGTLREFRSSVRAEGCRPVSDGEGAAIIQRDTICSQVITEARERAAQQPDRDVRYDAVHDCVMGQHDRTEQEQRDAEARRRRAYDLVVNRWVGTTLPCPAFLNVLEPVAIVQGYDPSVIGENADPDDIGVAGYEELTAHVETTRASARQRLLAQGVTLPSTEEMQASYDRGALILGQPDTVVHNTHRNCRLDSYGGSGSGRGGRATRSRSDQGDAPRPHRRRSRGGRRRRSRDSRQPQQPSTTIHALSAAPHVPRRRICDRYPAPLPAPAPAPQPRRVTRDELRRNPPVSVLAPPLRGRR